MPHRLHLVRHGEVENPDGVVYADLPGYGLSDLGRAQADRAGTYLEREGLTALWSSPLDRAVETAARIGTAVGLLPTTDFRLTEWQLARRWAGVPWSQLNERFPGEVEAYTAAPHDLPFSPESIASVAIRMAAAIADLLASAKGPVAVVSHQDPVQALRLHLQSIDLSRLPFDRPGHASVITLERFDGEWIEVQHWTPDLGGAPFPP